MINLKSVQSFSKAGYTGPLKPQIIKNVDVSKLSYIIPQKESNKKKSIFFQLMKEIYDFKKNLDYNLKEMGASPLDNIRAAFKNTPLAPGIALTDKIKSKINLANIAIQQRGSKKVINADFNKLDFGDDSIVYVLKNKKKQLGYIETTKDGNDIFIDFMTNILGRKKYRNIENKMLQAMVEDCIQNGFIPTIKADAVNTGKNIGRGYNNRELYKRMGMQKLNDGSMFIDKDAVLEIIQNRINKHDELIPGTKEALKKLMPS